MRCPKCNFNKFHFSDDKPEIITCEWCGAEHPSPFAPSPPSDGTPAPPTQGEMTLAPVEAKPARWEYLCTSFRCNYLDEMTEQLDGQGEEGWECFAVERQLRGEMPQFLVFAHFKRPLRS